MLEQHKCKEMDLFFFDKQSLLNECVFFVGALIALRQCLPIVGEL